LSLEMEMFQDLEAHFPNLLLEMQKKLRYEKFDGNF